MSLTSRPGREYHALIGQFASELPHQAVEVSDVCLTAEELQTVMRWHGARDLVTEALDTPRRNSKLDRFETVGLLATVGTLEDSCAAIGAEVMAAIVDYASELVVRDVRAYRDDHGVTFGEDLAEAVL